MTHTLPTPAPAVSGREVSKTYTSGRTSVPILHGVSLSVTAGEVVAVMGPSGSGKSTLLYCLAGLERPTGGEVTVLGRPLSSLDGAALARMRRAEVGFVFQSYNLVPTLTAFENVALPARLAGRKPDRERIVEVLTTVGMADRVEARPNTMSGGEQQRVALARVLAQHPQVVYADEPTGALDTRTGAIVLDELVRLGHEGGRCVLMVTHDPAVASRCDRVLFLRDGVLCTELARPTVEQVATAMTALTTEADRA